MKFFFILFAAQALVKPCHIKDLKCEIAGHSETVNKTYYAICAKLPQEQQLEFSETLNGARFVNAVSRESLGVCVLEKSAAKALIKSYEASRQAVENPPCYLSQWKGQMMFIAHGNRGRCTFDMKREKA